MPKQVKVLQQVAPRLLAPSPFRPLARHTIGNPDFLEVKYKKKNANGKINSINYTIPKSIKVISIEKMIKINKFIIFIVTLFITISQSYNS